MDESWKRCFNKLHQKSSLKHGFFDNISFSLSNYKQSCTCFPLSKRRDYIVHSSYFLLRFNGSASLSNSISASLLKFWVVKTPQRGNTQILQPFSSWTHCGSSNSKTIFQLKEKSILVSVWKMFHFSLSSPHFFRTRFMRSGKRINLQRLDWFFFLASALCIHLLSCIMIYSQLNISQHSLFMIFFYLRAYSIKETL